MVDAITDKLADALILLPLFIVFVVVSGLIVLAVQFFFPEPQCGQSLISSEEAVKTGAGSALPTPEPAPQVRRRA